MKKQRMLIVCRINVKKILRFSVSMCGWKYNIILLTSLKLDKLGFG
ncbi:MAG TPA: hypothetical protein PKY59_03235 [Pyrinomonadaceae bacterium]|nr:hypothetical protein [Pyrinomonadaceae bacterium]